jgi:hypothetical protein
MKITRVQLRRIIKEEIEKAFDESGLDKPKRKCKPSERAVADKCMRRCKKNKDCCKSDFCEKGQCIAGC